MIMLPHIRRSEARIIVRLHDAGKTQLQIAATVQSSRSRVAKILRLAEKHGLEAFANA